jgi:hypothetical protein
MRELGIGLSRDRFLLLTDVFIPFPVAIRSRFSQRLRQKCQDSIKCDWTSDNPGEHKGPFTADDGFLCPGACHFSRETVFDGRMQRGSGRI